MVCLPILLCVWGSIVSDSSDEKLIIVNPFDIYEDNGFPGPVGSCNDSNCFKIDSCVCGDERYCLCGSLEDAFRHVEDNTVIAINGTIREFTTDSVLYNVTNISVIGYHEIITINCQARGSVEFKNCNNVIIKNITWISCGSNNDYRISFPDTISSDGNPYLLNFFDWFPSLYISMVCTLLFAQM